MKKDKELTEDKSLSVGIKPRKHRLPVNMFIAANRVCIVVFVVGSLCLMRQVNMIQALAGPVSGR